MKKLLLLLITLLTITSPAQTQTINHKFLDLPYEKEEKINSELLAYRAYLHTHYDTLLDKIGFKDDFVESLINTNYHLFESGKIYYNWAEAENYLSQITKELLGNQWTPSVKVKIVRDPDENAFMIEDGTIYVNIGLLASTDNESELAAILGHEYAHYRNMDSYRSFCEEVKATKKTKMFERLGVSIMGFQSRKLRKFRSFETQADSLGLALLMSSKFDPHGFISKFEHLQIMEEKYKNSKTYKPYYFQDHPATEDRIGKAKTALANYDTSVRKKFLVNESLFNSIRRTAIDETILLSLQDLDFQSATELCYRELLQYPNDEFYLFYISESLRRSLLEEPKRGKEHFISNKYFFHSTITFEKGKEPVIISKTKPKLSVTELRYLVNFNLPKVIFLNKNFQTAALPVNDLSKNDTIEFVTNLDAYGYFIERMKKLGYKSYLFSDFMNNVSPVDMIGSFSSSIPDINLYKQKAVNLQNYFATKSNGKTNFIFYKVEGYEKSYTSTFEPDRCCFDTLETHIDNYYRNHHNPRMEQWALDTIEHSKRNQFLMYTDALLSAYSNYDVRLKDVNGININKENKYVVDPIGMYPEIVDFIKQGPYNGTAFIEFIVDFLPPNPMANFNMPAVGLAKRYMKMFNQYNNNRVIIYLNIHYINYQEKYVKHKISSFMLPEKSDLDKGLQKIYDEITILTSPGK